jgi:PAS domain S-box-containing protein
MKKVLRILIVEDSEDDTLLMLHQIEKEGYDVEFERVETADEMKNMLSKRTWDIILSDYQMPHFNGIGALLLFKKSGIDIPFIIISGTIGEELAVEAMRTGAHDYIMKNNLHRLLPAIERELRESEIRAERKLLEQKQLQAEAERISEEKYRYIFDNISDGIFLLEVTEDHRFRNLEMNTSFLELTGIDRNSMVGKFLEEVMPLKTANATIAKYLHCVEEGCPLEEEIELNLPTGRHIFQSTLIPIRNDTGRIHRIVGISHDITNRKHAEEEVELKNKQLVKLNAEKDKFFSIIAHDLRDPFYSFSGLADLMANKLKSLSMDEIQEFSICMRDSAIHISRLLENLLQWARVQQGSMPFHPELLLLLQEVEECISMVMGLAKNKEIEIVYDVPANLKVFVDSNILQTTIRNIVSNAIKFTPKGGKIHLSAKTTRDKHVEVSIRDTGIGMKNEMINNLFRLDVRTNREGTEGEPSTGLGLLLCKEFVEKHGGRIWIESEVGKGSTFYFTMPMNPKQENI